MRRELNRRSFMTALGSIGGASALTAALPPRPPGAGSQKPAGPWDLSWLDTLTGTHKQIFAPGELRGHQPLHVVVNYLDACQEIFGLSFPAVNTVMGIARALPINAVDAIWAKYELGRLYELKDPDTGEWARRNVFLDKMPAPAGKVVGVKPLQARGTIFYQCNNALGGVAARLAEEFKRPPADVRADLLAGLNPGVKLVPAHTLLLGLCQERGCTYEQIG